MHCETKSSSSDSDERGVTDARPDLRVLLVEDSPVIRGPDNRNHQRVPGVKVAESVESERAAIEAVGRLDVTS